MPAEDIVSRVANISRLEPDPILFVLPGDPVKEGLVAARRLELRTYGL